VSVELPTFSCFEAPVIIKSRALGAFCLELKVRCYRREFSATRGEEGQAPRRNARDFPACHLERVRAAVFDEILGVDRPLGPRSKMLLNGEPFPTKFGHA